MSGTLLVCTGCGGLSIFCVGWLRGSICVVGSFRGEGSPLPPTGAMASSATSVLAAKRLVCRKFLGVLTICVVGSPGQTICVVGSFGGSICVVGSFRGLKAFLYVGPPYAKHRRLAVPHRSRGLRPLVCRKFFRDFRLSVLLVPLGVLSVL